MKKLLYLFIALFIAGSAYAQTVEFRVNMRVAIIKGNFNPASDLVHIAGTLNGWNTEATTLLDPNHDSIYTVTIDTFAVGTEVKFKFVKNSGEWEAISSDRSYTVPIGSGSYTAYFNNDSIANAPTASVEFRVNMRVAAIKGSFVPGTDIMHLAGTMNSWSTSATTMNDDNNDSIYSVIVNDLTVGSEVEFKFVRNSDGWENDPNRKYVIPESNGIYTAYFNNDSVTTIPSNQKDIAFTFSCNMEFEIVSGRFTPGIDTLTARGSMNGWSGTDIMTPSSSDPNFYEKTITSTDSVGQTIAYKFAWVNKGVVTWESGSDRIYTVTQDDFNNANAYVERTYNDLTLDNITNNPVTVTFIVNMNGAVSSVTGQPFTSIDNVYIAGANPPLQWPNGGWPTADSATIHYLYNDGTHGDAEASDSLWTINLTFPQYSPLRVQYKYGANWGLDSNTGANDNESSTGTDHFITLSASLEFATVRNQFGVMGDHGLVTGVREIPNLLPNVYSLNQNYPNPFNPVTNIRFSVPQAGLVTLKLFNLIGQEVATLLNDFKDAGTYNVDFNAGNLSSGVYFYKINAGSFSSTKKMILMK